MSKRKKKSTNTSNLTLAITFAVFSILGYIGISLITGTGSFISTFGNPPSVASVVVDNDSTGAPIVEHAVTGEITNKKTGENVTKKYYKDSKPKGGYLSRQSKPVLPIVEPEIETTTTQSSVTCPGGNGTVIPVGMWVATGYAAKNDNGTVGRECVKCGENGRYNNKDKQACGDVYATDPSHTILPNHADDVYSGGIPSASSCYRGATLYPNGVIDNNERCYNGSWLDLDDANMTDYNAFMNNFCKHQGLVFDIATNKCQVKSAEAPVVEELATEQETSESDFQSYADICKERAGKNKQGNTKWIECIKNRTGGTTMTYLTCSAGFNSEGKCVDSADNIINSYQNRDTPTSVRITAQTKYFFDPKDCPPNTSPVEVYTFLSGNRYRCDLKSEPLDQPTDLPSTPSEGLSVDEDCPSNNWGTKTVNGELVPYCQDKQTSPITFTEPEKQAENNDISFFDDSLIKLFGKPEGAVCMVGDFQCSGDLVCSNRRCVKSIVNTIQMSDMSQHPSDCFGGTFKYKNENDHSLGGTCNYEKLIEKKVNSNISWWDDVWLLNKPEGSLCTIGNWQCKGELVCNNRRCVAKNTTSTYTPVKDDKTSESVESNDGLTYYCHGAISTNSMGKTQNCISGCNPNNGKCYSAFDKDNKE